MSVVTGPAPAGRVGHRSPLEEALGIPGAVAVALVTVAGGEVVWWAGLDPPGHAEAAALASVARGALGLLGDDDPGDILLTSRTAFHVLRLIEAEPGGRQLAHLRLRRESANLAMARHEFGRLTDRHVTPVAEPDATEPPAEVEMEMEVEVEAEALPRRQPGGTGHPASVRAHTETTTWLSSLGQSFTSDDTALIRVLGTLRRL